VQRSPFWKIIMHVKATSLAKKIDLRDKCGNLQLRPQNDEEAVLLSAIYRAMVFGGTITAKVTGKPAVKFTFEKS